MVNKQNFISMLLPHALEASKATGVDPRIIIAQGALESNWGKSAPGNNLFGIKSHGQSGGNTLATNEVINGKQVRINDSFRAYGSPAESVQGYADFITKNPRYGNFRSAQGLDNQIAELGKSGYATDPNYSNKISSIAQGIDINSPMIGSMSPVGPDGRKGQEMYPQPIMVADGKPPAERPIVNAGGDNYKTPVVPGAVKNMAGMEPRKNGIADIFSLMALNNQPQPIQQAQIQGPTPEQANALNRALQALRGRLG